MARVTPLIRILLLVVLTSTAAWGSGHDPFPQAASAYLLQLNGKTIWSHNADRRLPPASLTKIMTALIILERAHLDDVVTISPGAARSPGSSLKLQTGDRMRVADLLAAAQLVSANDACLALAEHLAGSEERFVTMMNDRARELGMRNTKFTNACGHDRQSHYSTADDLAILARATMTNPIYSELTATVRKEIGTADGSQSFTLENRNELIGRYDGAYGVKTGTTAKAGKCLVVMATRKGNTVLLVLLNVQDRWGKATAMLDEAFAVAEAVPSTKAPP